jgi:hypothetical protein
MSFHFGPGAGFCQVRIRIWSLIKVSDLTESGSISGSTTLGRDPHYHYLDLLCISGWKVKGGGGVSEVVNVYLRQRG